MTRTLSGFTRADDARASLTRRRQTLLLAALPSHLTRTPTPSWLPLGAFDSSPGPRRRPPALHPPALGSHAVLVTDST
ncbi:hypothetical protein PsYK624_107700 [Phanerochaete sordida]|uniref:Uncharacterized protein n=1 Tax=Phanerochaete sordida TaxID=48140 RepID=A0A9P3LGR9_9APHY|nr:hypothetical protein PsYK624_107700 [Phanerochaete sordida]